MRSSKSTFKTESRRGHPLTEEMILQACVEWFTENGKWPTYSTEMITDGILEGNTWASIQMAFRQGGRGLTKGKYKGISDFLSQNNLKQKFARASNLDITENMILIACHEWFETHGKWPSQNRETITKGMLAGKRWDLVSELIRKGSFGLPENKYKGLGDFKRQHGLVNGATPETAIDFAQAANPDYQMPEPSSKIASQLFSPRALG